MGTVFVRWRLPRDPSKDKLLYEQAKRGNVDGIRDLYFAGAGVEWKDKDGKTPLIHACNTPDFVEVVRVLIKLGANVDAHSPGHSAGTPLHHAAQKGFVQTVELLLDSKANPLSVNDDRKNPLDLARANNHLEVVRLIESRICLFAGWLRELHWRSISGETSPQRGSPRKIWAVVLPYKHKILALLPEYQLAIYSDLQAVQPNPIIKLRKNQITEPDFNQPDPALVIVDEAKKKLFTEKRYKFLSENEGDKQQLQSLHNACKGICQDNTYRPTRPAFTPMPSVPLSSPHANQPNTPIGTSAQQAPPMVPLPSAPPIDETFYADSIRYPSIDSSPVDLTVPAWEVQPGTNLAKEGGSSSSPIDLTEPDTEIKRGTSEINEGGSISGSCVICLDARAEGACIPCGHVAGCMSCLKEIEAKKWGCPVCRAKIDLVIKLYAV